METSGLPELPIPQIEFIFDTLLAPVGRSVLAETVLFSLFVYIASVLYCATKDKRGLSLLWNIISSPRATVSRNFSSAGRRPKRSKNNELGSGDLATNEQILGWTRPSGKKGDTKLKVDGLRGAQGVALPSGELIIEREKRNRHVLIISKTGGGKTTKMILPMLYSDALCPDRSTIVIDSKPEMWRKLAGMTRKYNPDKEIFLFNPLDRARSLSWNILAKVEDDTDAKLIANTVVMATDQPGSKSDSESERDPALERRRLPS